MEGEAERLSAHAMRRPGDEGSEVKEWVSMFMKMAQEAREQARVLEEQRRDRGRGNKGGVQSARDQFQSDRARLRVAAREYRRSVEDLSYQIDPYREDLRIIFHPSAGCGTVFERAAQGGNAAYGWKAVLRKLRRELGRSGKRVNANLAREDSALLQ